MKEIALFLILLLYCGLTSCTGKGFSDFKLEYRDGLWYKKDSNTPYTGVYRLKSPMADLLWEETEYKNGMPVLEKTYNARYGELILSTVTKAWNIDSNGNIYPSDYIKYGPSGKIEDRISYNGSKGTDKGYYPNGALHREVDLQEGRRHGLLTEYFEDGKIKLQSEWETGIQKGFVTEYTYHENGALMSYEKKNNAPLKDSRGEHKRYYANDALEREGEWSPEGGWGKTYSREGILIEDMITLGRENLGNSDHKYYFEDTGKLKEELSRRDGREVFRRSYYKNGKIRALLQNDIEKQYDKDGKILAEVVFKHETQMPVSSKTFYKNGKLRSDLCFKNGYLNGVQTRYNPDGKIEAEINFMEGEVTDKDIKTFHANGNLQSRLRFDNNGEIIEGEVYYPEGKLLAQRTIKEGEPLVNIFIYPDNEIFSEHHHGNTFSLSYIIGGGQNKFPVEYFEADRLYAGNEDVSDCSCGPDENDPENYEYIYAENSLSGILKIYRDPMIEIIYKKGERINNANQ